MQLARVVGSVVSTQKSPTLIGKKLLLVRRVAGDGTLPPDSNTPDEVAVDSVGAGQDVYKRQTLRRPTAATHPEIQRE